MKQLKLIVVACFLIVALSAQAEGGQVVTINGKTVEKVVTRITFEGDNVVLTYTDETTETVDMSHVSIVFTVTDAVKALSNEPENAAITYFDLSGRQLKDAPQQGGYLIKKGNTVVKLIRK